MNRGALLLLVGVLLAVADARPARACAACACGSNAALPAGAELPFAGRLRTTTSLIVTSTTTTSRLGSAVVTAASLPLTLTRAIDEHVSLDVTFPLGLRLLSDGEHGGGGWGVGGGDLVVGARGVWRDRALAPRLMLGGRVGAILPTTTALRRGDGALRAAALQPGGAALGPVLEASAAWFAAPETVVMTTWTGLAPLWSLLAHPEAPSLLGRAFVLRRVTDRLSLRAGALVRATAPGATALDAKAPGATAPGDEAGGDEARVGVGPEVGVVVDLRTDVILAATASVPAWHGGGDIFDGGRAELALAVDW
jgi:hypothetical protein